MNNNLFLLVLVVLVLIVHKGLFGIGKAQEKSM